MTELYCYCKICKKIVVCPKGRPLKDLYTK